MADQEQSINNVTDATPYYPYFVPYAMYDPQSSSTFGHQQQFAYATYAQRVQCTYPTATSDQNFPYTYPTATPAQNFQYTYPSAYPQSPYATASVYQHHQQSYPYHATVQQQSATAPIQTPAYKPMTSTVATTTSSKPVIIPDNNNITQGLNSEIPDTAPVADKQQQNHTKVVVLLPSCVDASQIYLNQIIDATSVALGLPVTLSDLLITVSSTPLLNHTVLKSVVPEANVVQEKEEKIVEPPELLNADVPVSKTKEDLAPVPDQELDIVVDQPNANTQLEQPNNSSVSKDDKTGGSKSVLPTAISQSVPNKPTPRAIQKHINYATHQRHAHQYNKYENPRTSGYHRGPIINHATQPNSAAYHAQPKNKRDSFNPIALPRTSNITKSSDQTTRRMSNPKDSALRYTVLLLNLNERITASNLAPLTDHCTSLVNIHVTPRRSQYPGVAAVFYFTSELDAIEFEAHLQALIFEGKLPPLMNIENNDAHKVFSRMGDSKFMMRRSNGYASSLVHGPKLGVSEVSVLKSTVLSSNAVPGQTTQSGEKASMFEGSSISVPNPKTGQLGVNSSHQGYIKPIPDSKAKFSDDCTRVELASACESKLADVMIHLKQSSVPTESTKASSPTEDLNQPEMDSSSNQVNKLGVVHVDMPENHTDVPQDACTASSSVDGRMENSISLFTQVVETPPSADHPGRLAGAKCDGAVDQCVSDKAFVPILDTSKDACCSNLDVINCVDPTQTVQLTLTTDTGVLHNIL